MINNVMIEELLQARSDGWDACIDHLQIRDGNIKNILQYTIDRADCLLDCKLLIEKALELYDN